MACELEFLWVDLGGFTRIKVERPNLGLAKQTRIARIDTNLPGFLAANADDRHQSDIREREMRVLNHGPEAQRISRLTVSFPGV
jgi:hypothetical protein